MQRCIGTYVRIDIASLQDTSAATISVHQMPKQLWHHDTRFVRVGERDGKGFGCGGYGRVFMAFDELKQQTVVVKRQPVDFDSGGREAACFKLLEAFPHQNLIKMHAIWTSSYKESPWRRARHPSGSV